MGYGLDEKGMKMSKSKGNALDPLPIIEKSGADTFRFWSASEFNSKVWNTKKEKGLSLKDSIKIEIPKELDIFKKDLAAMHNLG